MTVETVRLRVRNVGNAVLVSGQAYQDPKDALNEFVSNAADEYAEAGVEGGRVRIYLRRKGRRPLIAVEDDGRGLTAERLRELARSLFQSRKAGDDRTLGEKAIGILAFQQLGARCDIVSRADGESHTSALRLERGRATAALDLNERRRARPVAGTTVYLYDLDPDVLRVLTQRKVVDYLRRRRGPALERGDYSIEVVEGRSGEIVTPEPVEGVRIELPAHVTLWGRVEFDLRVVPRPDRHRRVAVVGRAGIVIIDDLAELDEFDRPPWTTDQIAGRIVFGALQQTAGRRAILRDRDAFPVFVDAVCSIEPVAVRALERVSREVTDQVADRMSDAVRKIFGRVLRELADLDNPMRTALGSEPGVGAVLTAAAGGGGDALDGSDLLLTHGYETAAAVVDPASDVADRTQPDVDAAAPDELVPGHARADQRRARPLPSIAPDPEPGEARSRFDEPDGVVYYNEVHRDYLLVKDDDAALLDYLATLVAKEYVVYNNPRAAPAEVAEELVRMLVRVRRHLPRRTRGRER